MYGTLLLYQVTSFLVSGTGIGYQYRETPYYSVSGIGCLSVIVLTIVILYTDGVYIPIYPPLLRTSSIPVIQGWCMVKSRLRICGCADVNIDKLELNCIFRLGVRVRVSISIYLTDVIKLQIGSVLTNNIRRSANPQSAFYPLPSGMGGEGKGESEVKENLTLALQFCQLESSELRYCHLFRENKPQMRRRLSYARLG